MKKTLIAFAALTAIAGVAQAQSSVTLYGLVDAFVGQTSTEKNSANPALAQAKTKQTVVNSSGQNFSRWGIKGTEDLGNGMSAYFILESGFNTDDGTYATGVGFGRQSLVGLKGNFGSVSLGRQYTAHQILRNATNHMADTNFATTNSVWGLTGGVPAYNSRANNSVVYASPDFGGISGVVSYGMGENKNAPGNVNGDSTDNVALHIKYANGPVLVGYSHQEEKLARVGALSQDKNKYDLFAGYYDFGVAKLNAGYQQSKNDTFKNKEYQVGVTVPFGAAALSAGYSHSKADATGISNKGNGVSLFGTYALSKRTNLYTGFLRTKLESANAAVETKNTTFGLGVKHLF